MGQSKELAQMTIKDLKEHHPDYYNQMRSKCRVCQNIMSSMECELCENFDMFVKVEVEE